MARTTNVATNNPFTQVPKEQEKKTPSVGASIATFLSRDAVRQNIINVVGEMQSTRFITSIVSAVQNTPALKECTNASIFSAALLGQGLELSPSPQLGQFYMLPFENKKTGIKEASFVLGYKGYIQLAVRSGQYKNINVIAVKKGELKRYNPLTEEIELNLIEDWDQREKAETVGYFAFFKLVNGFEKAMYWSKDRMLAHADKYSPAFSLNATKGKYPKVSYADYVAGKYESKWEWLYSSFWYQDFDGMAYKTMLRQLISKWGPMSIDMQTAFSADNSVVDEHGYAVEYTEEYPDYDVIDSTGEEVPEETQEAQEAQAEGAAKQETEQKSEQVTGNETNQ